jgi:hypothetical protein
MEPEGSLPHLQEPAICPCPEPDQFSHASQSHSLKIHFKIIFQVYPCVFEVISFPRVSPPKSCMHLSPTHATCSAHLILLDTMTWLIFGDEYRSWANHVVFSNPCYLIPSTPKYLLQHPILVRPQRMFSFCVRRQVPHPYKTTGTII